MTRTTSKSIARPLAALALASALGLGAAAPASAQGKSTEGWSAEIVPYLWGAGIKGSLSNGTIGTGGVDADIDISFSEILDHLDMALMGAAEARYGRWGLLFDGVYLLVSDDVPTHDRQGDAKFKFQQQLYSLAPAYRVFDDEVFVDVLAGVRYLYLKTSLEVPPGHHPPIATGRKVSASASWWGGFGGVRVAWPLPFAKEVSLVGYLDLGEMDGSFMWQGIAGANWQITDMFSAKLGYRYLSFKVGAGSTEFDLDTSGFYAGLGIKF